MAGEIWRRFGECTGDAFERYVKGWVFLPYIFGFARELWKLNVADSFVELGISNAWIYQPKNCPESGSGASCFRTIHVAKSLHQQAAALCYTCLLQPF